MSCLATGLPYDLRSYYPIIHIPRVLFFYILQYPHRVKLILAAISPSRSRAKSGAAATLAADFLARASRFLPCEAQAYGSEAALLAWLDRQAARTVPVLILLDSRGRQLSSEDFAAADRPPARLRHAVAGARHRPGRRLVHCSPCARRPAALVWSHHAAPRARPRRSGRADLPRADHSRRPSLPLRTLNFTKPRTRTLYPAP